MDVGFVGLGNLGRPMALALARTGLDVLGFDRDPARQVGRVATRLSDLANCDVLALAVPDDRAVEEVLAAIGLKSGAIVLVHSTVLPQTAQRLAREAVARGIGLLDAPVSGGAARALDGDLTVMVGGDPVVFDRARPVLDRVGSTVRHVGPPGAGAAVKLANQLMMFSALAGVHEALDLTAAHGVAESDVLEVVASGTGDSWVARNWGFFDRVAADYSRAGTPVADRPWSKDLGEVLAAAEAAGVDLPVAKLLAGIIAERIETHARESR